MNFLLDLGVLLLFGLFIFSGVKRGIVYMGINIAGTIGAALVSSFLASLCALPLYDALIKNNLLNSLTDATQGLDKSEPAKAAQTILETLNNFTLNTFSFTGIDTATLTNTIKKTNLSLPEMLEGMLRPMAVKMVSIVLTIIFFLILMMIVAFLARKFTRSINKTILGVPNRVLGGIVGAVEALVIIMLLTMIIHFVMMFLSPEDCANLNSDINQTWLYQYIYRISIPDAIINWLTLK